jgi:hypothetical protein
MADKDMAAIRLGTTVSQVLGQCLADSLGKRQFADAPFFRSADAKAGPPPVDVLKEQGSDFTDPKAEVQQTDGQGVIPSASGIPALETGEKPMELLVGHEFGDVGQLPLGDVGHRGDQARRAMAAQLKPAKETAERRSRNLGRARAAAATISGYEGLCMMGSQERPAQRTANEYVLQELASIPGTIAAG